MANAESKFIAIVNNIKTWCVNNPTLAVFVIAFFMGFIVGAVLL